MFYPNLDLLMALFATYFRAKSQTSLIKTSMSLIIIFVKANLVYWARLISVNGSMPTIPRRSPEMRPCVSCCCFNR